MGYLGGEFLGSVRVVIIGNSGVGKTSLVTAFLRTTVDKQVKPTIGAICNSYEGPKLENGQRVLFHLWDTAGQEAYACLSRFYYRDARIALCVFDVTSMESLDGLSKWYGELRTHAPDAIVYLIGNKIDRKRPETLDHDRINAKAEEIGARSVHYASAWTRVGLKEAFATVINDAMELKLYGERVAQPEVRETGCCW